MTAHLPRPGKVASVLAASAVLAVTSSLPASAAEGQDVTVVNTETVQVYTDATGAVESQRVYEQLALSGTGTVDLANPIETQGLRNLDEFGGFDLEDELQVVRSEVDGEEHLRSVSDYTGELPLSVSVTYLLDGEEVRPSALVGGSGELEVRYTVTNATAEDREVTFDDGSGGSVTKTVSVPLPIVGSLSTVLPGNFTDVASPQANVAGDGKGGTKLSFTMTLFPPLGSDTAEFGYTATLSDGLLPRASITALPVNPLESPTFRTAADSYRGGADTGLQLTAGATEIDENVLKLRDGAEELLAGLIQLRDGAFQLDAGLTGTAVPGATALADGASDLDAGARRLGGGTQALEDGSGRAAAGAQDLSDGAGRLDAGLGDLGGGAGDLDAGAARLTAGQRALEGGLKDLYDAVQVLPSSVADQLSTNPDYQALLGALSAISDGVGTTSDSPATPTLLGGLKKLEYGLDNPLATASACDAGDADRCGVTDGLDRIAERLDLSLGTGGSVDQTEAAILSVKSTPDCGVVCSATVDGVAAQVRAGQVDSLTDLRNGVRSISSGVKTSILASGAGLDQLRAGLSNGNPALCAAAAGTADTADDCGISQAAQAVAAGVPQLVNEVTASVRAQIVAGLGRPTAGCDPEAALRCAAAALTQGGDDLRAGMELLVSGVSQLNAGGAELASGAEELAAGVAELDAGAGQLDDGAATLVDGSSRLADGASQLADGLTEAGDGSGRLADGLREAADSAPALGDGAQELSDRGTSALVAAGEATSQEYGELYATITAGAQRAEAEDMAYGAPEGAVGLTAYSFEIQGEDGETGRNLVRGLGGLVVLGAGATVFGLRRRLL